MIRLFIQSALATPDDGTIGFLLNPSHMQGKEDLVPAFVDDEPFHLAPFEGRERLLFYPARKAFLTAHSSPLTVLEFLSQNPQPSAAQPGEKS